MFLFNLGYISPKAQLLELYDVSIWFDPFTQQQTELNESIKSENVQCHLVVQPPAKWLTVLLIIPETCASLTGGFLQRVWTIPFFFLLLLLCKMHKRIFLVNNEA